MSPAGPGVPTDTKAESQTSHGLFLMYYGSEFTSNHYDAWAHFRGIDVDFIRSGKPVYNASFDVCGADPGATARSVFTSLRRRAPDWTNQGVKLKSSKFARNSHYAWVKIRGEGQASV